MIKALSIKPAGSRDLRAIGYVLCAAVLAVMVMSGQVGAEIPEDSREKLSCVFAEVRDLLWEANDYYWHRGDFERCIALLRLITEIDPRDTEAFANASWLMWNADRNSEAEAFLKIGLAQNPDVDDLYSELGFFYFRAQRYAEAVDTLRSAVKLSSHPTARHLLAHALERSGNTQEALSIWRECERLEPDSPVPKIQIELILNGEPPPALPQAAP